MREPSSRAPAIVVDTLGWSQLRKLKIDTAYNQTLLGAGTEDTTQRLFSLPVYVNPGITNYSGLVIDKTGIVSAVGPVQIATSEHTDFSSDGVGVGALWRFGHVVVRPARIGKLAIQAANHVEDIRPSIPAASRPELTQPRA